MSAGATRDGAQAGETRSVFQSLDEEDRYQILATSGLSTSDGRTLKNNNTFAMLDRHGDITPLGLQGAQGLYTEGTRFLSSLRLRLNGQRLLLLNSTVRENNILFVADLMSPDVFENGELLIAHGALHVLRAKFLWHGTCYEHLQISNYGMRAVSAELTLDFDADFADLFEVRGSRRERRGQLHAAVWQSGGVQLSYTGLDARRRTTRINFAPEPTHRGDTRVSFDCRLDSKQTKDLYITVLCHTEDGHAGEGRAEPGHVGDGRTQGADTGDVDTAWQPRKEPLPEFDAAYRGACAALAESERKEASISTSNEEFNDWLQRSIADLRMMISQTQYGPYPYAGIPWFSVPFGRDGVLTALELLWVDPQLARGVLEFLAATQAHDCDPARDAEPGKIVHEMRQGEMAALGEVPFGRYYGSVDATPLFVMLAAAYHELTGDTSTIERLWPNLERALSWIEREGDPDADGFVEYCRRSENGLSQQGWKDSQDSVFHADGSLARGPIALCEVQGYAYAARLGAARLASALGLYDRARLLESAASSLQMRFDAAFWCDDLQTYALALDGSKRACRVRSSNAGHCLFTGIAKTERAAALAEQLVSEPMFSGWGVRTLAANECRYNPLSYHNGSVWPHDNALIGAGLARYGYKEHANRILEGLFDAARFADLHRLPELFCGLPRRVGAGPTLYPVACSPQAWAAGTPFLLLGAVLGMSIDGARRRVSFDQAQLPAFLPEVTIRGLHVGESRLDLRLQRHPDDLGISVMRRSGPAEVLIVK
jgi:glycogen debranching enzyme